MRIVWVTGARRLARWLLARGVARVLPRFDEGESAARKAADGFAFTDFWEADCSEWNARYVWCCYALSWAVRQYDAVRACAA